MTSRRLTPPGVPDAPVIIALTDAGQQGTAPAAEDLFIYAELLGLAADTLAARDPLPGVTEMRNLPAERAVKIAQVGSIAEGAFADDLA